MTHRQWARRKLGGRFAGVAWGSLFVLTSVLVAAYIVDALPDSVTGMFKVSQVMVRVFRSLVKPT